MDMPRTLVEHPSGSGHAVASAAAERDDESAVTPPPPAPVPSAEVQHAHVDAQVEETSGATSVVDATMVRVEELEEGEIRETHDVNRERVSDQDTVQEDPADSVDAEPPKKRARGEPVLPADPVAAAQPNCPGDPSHNPSCAAPRAGGAETESLEKKPTTVTASSDTTDTHELLPRPTLKRIPSC